VTLHADAVAEDGAARERGVRVGGQHGDGPVLLAQQGDDRVDQRRLARPRSARETGDAGISAGVAQRFLNRPNRGITSLDQGDRLGQGANVAGSELTC
jgi:hypothetical protein